MIASEPIRVAAADGYSLAATVFRPRATEPVRHAVLICPAMGVRQAYYYDFAEYVAERGAAVVTFDYRGVAGSAPKRLRGFPATLQDWGKLDMTALVAHVRATFPELPLSAVVHSVGGQLLGLARNANEVPRVLALGAQSGYWRHWDGFDRLRVWLLWHLFIPVLAPAFGYFPSPWFGLGRSIPRDVARQWAYWGRHPRYVVGRVAESDRDGYERYAGQIRSTIVSDDWIAPERAARALLELYPSARREFRVVPTAELGLREVGHFGYFRERLRDRLWPAAVDWLIDS